jgi:hypothetical protein
MYTMTQTAKDGLVTKGEAQRLLGISRTKLDKVIMQNNIPLKRDPMDERIRLVDIAALRRVLTRKD